MTHNPSLQNRFAKLGETAWLLSQSKMHDRIQLDEMGALFFYPESLGQMRRWYRNGGPVGLATWAWLDSDTTDIYLETGQIPTGRWQSGPDLWFVDLIAPFGDATAITRELRQIIPEGGQAYSARWSDTGQLLKVGKFKRARLEGARTAA